MEPITEAPYSFSKEWTWQVVIFSILGVVIVLSIAAIIVLKCSIIDTPCYLLGIKMGCKKKKKDPPLRSYDAQAPTNRPGLNLGGDTKTKSSDSVAALNLEPTPTLHPEPTPLPSGGKPVEPPNMDVIDATGQVKPGISSNEWNAAIEGGLVRERADDESVDDVDSDWGKTLPGGEKGAKKGVKKEEATGVTQGNSTKQK